jgi:hypothetical protein
MLKNRHMKHDFFEKLNMDEKKFKITGSFGKIYSEIFCNKSKIIVIS